MSPPLPPEVLEQLGLDEHCCEGGGGGGHEATMAHEPASAGSRGGRTGKEVELRVRIEPDVASMLDQQSDRLSEPGGERLSRSEIAAIALRAWARELQEGKKCEQVTPGTP